MSVFFFLRTVSPVVSLQSSVPGSCLLFRCVINPEDSRKIFSARRTGEFVVR